MTPAVEVTNLAKHYGHLRALDGVSFSVGQGEIFRLLGPNGAGKSTMIRILTGRASASRKSGGYPPRVAAGGTHDGFRCVAFLPPKGR